MNSQTALRMAVAVGCTLGLLLGGVQVINHSLDVLTNLQPPVPAIRGVAMWAIMFLLCGAASSIAYGRTRTVPCGILASIIAAVSGAALLVGFAAAGLAAIAHATGLERSARPPFILFALPAVALARAVAAPAFRALTLATSPPNTTADGH